MIPPLLSNVKGWTSSTRKAIHVVMVTDLPLTRNAWSKEVSGFVSADDLFAAD